MAKPRAVWVARNAHPLDDDYELYTNKPTFDGRSFYEDSLMKAFCSSEFESITGFKLAPGACVKVQIQVKQVKP